MSVVCWLLSVVHTYPSMKVPPTFALCFNLQCTNKETCLRYSAAQYIVATRKVGVAIYPSALQPDGSCAYYRENKIINHAYGFSNLFSHVKQKDAETLRNQIKQYLGGHGTYYRYNRGEKILTPLQQEWILNLFRKYGYNEPLTFDQYIADYDFSE